MPSRPGWWPRYGAGRAPPGPPRATARLPLVDVVPLDDHAARAVGQLCGVSGTTDVVDASVVLCARQRGHRVLTSDPDDLRRIDPRLQMVAV